MMHRPLVAHGAEKVAAAVALALFARSLWQWAEADIGFCDDDDSSVVTALCQSVLY